MLDGEWRRAVCLRSPLGTVFVLITALVYTVPTTGDTQVEGDLLWSARVAVATGQLTQAAIAVEDDWLIKGSRSVFVAVSRGDRSSAVTALDFVTGKEEWSATFERVGKALAIGVQDGRVFAAGRGTNVAGNTDFVVRAYKAEDGSPLWADRFDLAGFDDGAEAIVVQGNKVFAAGGGTNTLTELGYTDFVVRAYDANTGSVLWGDHFDMGGADAVAIAVQGGQVFAAGRAGPNVPGATDFVVRAFEANTGSVLWGDRFDLAGGEDEAVAIAVQGEQVFGAGWGTNAAGNRDLVVRAYDTNAGRLIWQNRFDLAGGPDQVAAIAVRAGRVFVTGWGANAAGNADFIVQSLDARTGKRVWQRIFDLAAGHDRGLAISVRAGRVFATGWGTNAAGNRDFILQSLDARTGAGVWQRTFDLAGGLDMGTDVEVNISRLGGLVFASGSGTTATGTPELFVRAYWTGGGLQLVGLEAVQVVQDWSNTVPLIEGKVTYVRAHVATMAIGGNIGFDSQLRGFRVAPGSGVLTEFPESPLVPTGVWGGGFARPYVKLNDIRRLWEPTTANFRLPDPWLSGTIVLRLEPYSVQPVVPIDCWEIADVPYDCSVKLSFVPASPLAIRFFPVEWTDASGVVHTPDITELAQSFVAMYPIHELVWTSSPLVHSGQSQPTIEQITGMLLAVIQSESSSCDPQVATNPLCIAVVRTDQSLCCVGPRLVGGVTRVDPAGTTTHAIVTYRPPFPSGLYGNISWPTPHHEAGHLLGLSHPREVGQSTGPCDEEGGQVFPNIYDVNGTKQATIGPMESGDEHMMYGLSTQHMNVRNPFLSMEMMSYCGLSPFQWISDYNYQALRASIVSRSAPPVPGQSLQAPEAYVLVRGHIDVQTGSAHLLPFVPVTSRLVRSLQAGDYALELRDARGKLVERIQFEPSVVGIDPQVDTAGVYPLPSASKVAHFAVLAKADTAVKRAAILHKGRTLTRRSASASAPSVKVIYPNGSETLSGSGATLVWEGNDADDDELTYTVQYSSDGGETWRTLLVDWPRTSFEVPLDLLRGSSNALMRVAVSDGFRSSVDSSDGLFSVSNHPPRVSVVSPARGSHFVGDQRIFFEALANDIEDGKVSNRTVKWASSIDGALGTGSRFSIKGSKLSSGWHVVTVSAKDSSGLASTDSVSIRVLGKESWGPRILLIVLALLSLLILIAAALLLWRRRSGVAPG